MPRIETYNPQAERDFYESNMYAGAVRAGDLLIVSGVIGFTFDHERKPFIPASIEEEIQNLFNRLQGILAEAKLGMEDIVNFDTFMEASSFADVLASFQEVKVKFLHCPFPAWTAVPVPFISFPGARLEVKTVARFVDNARR